MPNASACFYHRRDQIIQFIGSFISVPHVGRRASLHCPRAKPLPDGGLASKRWHVAPAKYVAQDHDVMNPHMPWRDGYVLRNSFERTGNESYGASKSDFVLPVRITSTWAFTKP